MDSYFTRLIATKKIMKKQYCFTYIVKTSCFSTIKTNEMESLFKNKQTQTHTKYKIENKNYIKTNNYFFK